MSLSSYNKRRPTHTVWVGQVGVGGNFPIRVQSMCTSDTKNTEAVLREIAGLVEAGCEIVRVTVPTQADCDNLVNIRAGMKKLGIKVPLVADIHFTPSIALKCVEFVDKVRINPGNFVDKKLFIARDYTDEEYAAEIVRIREKFIPLVQRCKEYGVAMRVGTNHGSLSDRIMNRYGDTPEGMVESALEFLRMCEELDYRQVILSMKASNVQVMVAAYRLLAHRLGELGWTYPFHLGVTEAGEGEDGRIKSAIGIGTLLEEGIGDTIRVSLTEDAVYEVPVAWQLVREYNSAHILNMAVGAQFIAPTPAIPATAYQRRHTNNFNIAETAYGSANVIRVWASVSGDFKKWIQDYAACALSPTAADTPIEGIEIPQEYFSDLESMARQIRETPAPVAVAVGFRTADPAQAIKAAGICDKITAVVSEDFKIAAWKPVLEKLNAQKKCLEWNVGANLVFALSRDPRDGRTQGSPLREIQKLVTDLDFDRVLFSVSSPKPVADYRTLATALDAAKIKAPVHLRVEPEIAGLLSSSISLGALLLDGLGDSIQIEGDLKETVGWSYNILQGCRLRISKTEYISCPSCGRTQFDLQTTTDRIRTKTGHLKGVKIAVMGCIVNGPGEMADADFGYVGTGPKKVSLYVSKECVERNIPEGEAVDRLIALIKSHDRWVEPVSQ